MKKISLLIAATSLASGVLAGGCDSSSQGTTGQPVPSQEERVQAIQNDPNLSEREKSSALAEMDRRRAETEARKQAAQNPAPAPAQAP